MFHFLSLYAFLQCISKLYLKHTSIKPPHDLFLLTHSHWCDKSNWQLYKKQPGTNNWVHMLFEDQWNCNFRHRVKPTAQTFNRTDKSRKKLTSLRFWTCRWILWVKEPTVKTATIFGWLTLTLSTAPGLRRSDSCWHPSEINQVVGFISEDTNQTVHRQLSDIPAVVVLK